MWQGQLQVHAGGEARPGVLLVGQLREGPHADGLHPEDVALGRG